MVCRLSVMANTACSPNTISTSFKQCQTPLNLFYQHCRSTVAIRLIITISTELIKNKAKAQHPRRCQSISPSQRTPSEPQRGSAPLLYTCRAPASSATTRGPAALPASPRPPGLGSGPRRAVRPDSAATTAGHAHPDRRLGPHPIRRAR